VKLSSDLHGVVLRYGDKFTLSLSFSLLYFLMSSFL